MCCANLLAQQYQFVYYTPRDGLVNSRVRSIKQDSKGQMYFITYGGLSIYDGVKFKNYRKQDGLADELVNDIIEISPDSFLVATNSSLLNTLVRGKIGVFKTADNFYPVSNKFLKGNDGILYVIADDGLFKLVGNKFERIPLLDSNGEEIGHNLDRITEWNQYLLMIPWNLQKEKLIIYNKENQSVAGTITDQKIISTAVSPDGELWVSTQGKIKLLNLTALQKGEIILTPLSSSINERGWRQHFIYFDPNGDSWIYQNSEVNHLTTSGSLRVLSSAEGLKTSNLSDIIVDREGITWMASDGNGIVKMPGTNVQILNDFIPGIKNNISAIHHQSDTTWCFNLTNNCFYRIHHDQLKSFPLHGEFNKVRSFNIVGKSIYYLSDNKFFTVGNKDLLSSYTNPVEILQDVVSIVQTGAGIVDPYGNIIHCIRSSETDFYLAVISGNKILMKSKLSFIADQIMVDHDNSLWVPTRDNHLLVFSLHPESPVDYLRQEYDFSNQIAGFSPRSITVDTNDNIWLGTRYNGIYKLQFEGKKFKSSFQLTTSQGLTDNFHYQLHCDPQNNIWAGSQTGLDKISLKNGEYIIENFTKSKNIFQGIHKIINVEDQIIWALTSNGDIIRISNVASDQIYPIPAFFISSLSVNDQENDLTSSVFTHDQNNFSISVAAPSFIDEKSILYSYWLKGSSKNNWSEPSNNAQFHFINLAPGAYTLHVKAEFPAKFYPPQQIHYAFVIRPPFWQTWWFLLLLGLTVLSIINFVVRYYYNNKLEKQKILLEKKQAIEKERTRIATDMHDDLGAGLSRIKFLSETIGIKKQMHQPIEAEINNIRQYAHEMIDKMGEIVWALNEKNDSLNDLLSYTRAYAVEYLSENGIQSNIDKIPPIKPKMVNGEFRRNIYLSVKEALHNVIKHSRANDVSIHFAITDKLIITIHDDGIGFNGEQQKPYANGLNNMHKRMAEIGGSMSILHDHGTRVILTAPLPA